MISPLSISKFLDNLNEIINKKKHIFRNTNLINNFVTKRQTKEKTYLTQAENLILFLNCLMKKMLTKKYLKRCS